MAGFPPSRILLIGILWVASCVWTEASQNTAAQLFPPQATVLLLAGVPGDTESENAYRDQLHTWLALAAQSGPHQVFLLADQPESLGISASPDLQMLEATRTNFLRVCSSVAGTTNPLVVIAFGHGGRQGTTPVLHVRGPRLIPADFAALAALLKQAPSHWLLLFRGSGAFAHNLAGEGRQIFASECDTSFSSDPIGMTVLLKILRANPSISFPDLGAQAGKAIASWYSSRNLARTEEPTFWDSEAAPRKLAPSQEDHDETQTQTPDQKASGPKVESHDSQPPASSATESARSVESELWNDIKPVKSQDYPDSDGVVLRRVLRCVIGSNPAIASDQDEYIQILSSEGKTLADFDVTYSPPEEELEFLDCEVLRPDGKVVRLDPEDIGQSQEPDAGDYQAGRRRFFSLPDAVPGAILHVHYRTEWKKFPLPSVAMALPIPQELPVLDSQIQISVPKDSPFHFLFEGLSPPDPAIASSGYSTSYTWHLPNQPQRRREILSPPHQATRLLFSTFTDWQAFAAWYGRISKLADEVTPEIAAKARELTADAQSDRAKVEALYVYVNALRYVAVPLGVNSLRPHAAANVLQHQFGDCKDKANLLNTLLHALNLQADLVLVPRFTQAYDLVPGVGFNHAISRVKLQGETVWIDSTDDICRFGLLPPGDPGRKVLVIDGSTTTLTQLPEPSPEDHRLQISGELQPGEEGGWSGKLAVKAHGYPDYELREVARETKGNHDAMPLLAAKLRPANGSFALENQTASSVSAMAGDFAWHAEGTFLGLTTTLTGQRLLRAPFWLPREWEAALHQRHSPLFLNQGYPLTLDEQFSLQLPNGSRCSELPPARENNEGPLHWRIEWTRVADDKLAAHFQAQLIRGDLSLAETMSFQKQLRPLITTLGLNATFAGSP